jgi:hypothetical protein
MCWGEALMGQKMTAVIRRWRELLQRRRADRLERKVHARENLRDFNPGTGHESGMPLF